MEQRVAGRIAVSRAPERRLVVAGEHTDERTVILKGLAAREQILLEGPG